MHVKVNEITVEINLRTEHSVHILQEIKNRVHLIFNYHAVQVA